MVTKGIRRELDVKRIDGSRIAIQATIATPGVGHYFPTYVVPKVTVTLQLVNSAGSEEIARRVIGRSVSVDMDRELFDTRIPPGGKSVLSAELAIPAGENHIEMRMEVAPANHYARMYQTMLDRNPGMDKTTRTILREALREALATSYRLDDLEVAVPSKLGMLQQLVAN